MRRPRRSSGLFLLRTLVRSFGPAFLRGTLCLLLHDAAMFAVPQVLGSVSGVKGHNTFIIFQISPAWRRGGMSDV